MKGQTVLHPKYFEKKKILACVAALLLACILTGCNSMPLRPSKEALSVVGHVGEFEVLYEELYFVTQTMKAEINAKYGEGAAESAQYADELRAMVFENILGNYAVLTLCREAGIELESKQIADAVQEQIDNHIQNDLDGDRGAYLDELREMGSTDHYIRLVYRVEELYSALQHHYVSNGILASDEALVRKIINDEFIRTCHIMILNENHSEDNLAMAEEALLRIRQGTSMYSMIGSKYNHDYGLTTLDGYYFTRGIMDEAYEEAAYALEINEKSGIVAAKGQNEKGKTVDCYYIIQRLALDEDYIDSHFDALRDQYYESQIFLQVSAVEENLRFILNTYGQTLNLASLDAPAESDPLISVIIVSIAGGILVVGAGVVVTVVLVKRRNKRILERAAKLHGGK